MGENERMIVDHLNNESEHGSAEHVQQQQQRRRQRRNEKKKKRKEQIIVPEEIETKTRTKNTQKLLAKYHSPTPLDTRFKHKTVDLGMANDDPSFDKKLAMLDQASDEVKNEKSEHHNQRFSTMSIGSDQSDYSPFGQAQQR